MDGRFSCGSVNVASDDACFRGHRRQTVQLTNTKTQKQQHRQDHKDVRLSSAVVYGKHTHTLINAAWTPYPFCPNYCHCFSLFHSPLWLNLLVLCANSVSAFDTDKLGARADEKSLSRELIAVLCQCLSLLHQRNQGWGFGYLIAANTAGNLTLSNCCCAIIRKWGAPTHTFVLIRV